MVRGAVGARGQEPAAGVKPGEGFPCADQGKYLRFGNGNGIEPLVFTRSFQGIGEDYVEISEEFRHFHNLHDDHGSGTYVKFGDGGEENIVAVVDDKVRRVKIRLKEIRQFLAIKEMHLAIQFDCTEWSGSSLEELELPEGLVSDEREGFLRWRLGYRDFESAGPARRTISRLLGVRLIEPLQKSNSGFPGLGVIPERKHAEFIIGMDENGDEIEHTCDPDTLADYFGGNPEAPRDITPVSFRKQVLDKYYQYPSKYSISDGLLQFASKWQLRIDNHHNDKVVVTLADLGDLPYEEQLHWREWNIASGTGLGEISFSRQFQSQWAESDRPEHIFQEKYQELHSACQNHLGWHLLRPLDEGDQHHLKTVRVPASSEQQNFDELVLGLAKILIDSLNDQELKNLLLPEQRESLKSGKSISKLEAVFSSLGIDDAGEHIQFLKDLQALRSAGSAHRKGREYLKIAKLFEVDSKDLRTVFNGILQKAVAFLDYLFEVVQSQKLTRSNGKRS